MTINLVKRFVCMGLLVFLIVVHYEAVVVLGWSEQRV